MSSRPSLTALCVELAIIYNATRLIQALNFHVAVIIDGEYDGDQIITLVKADCSLREISAFRVAYFNPIAWDRYCCCGHISP
jgi:hypothetical protein